MSEPQTTEPASNAASGPLVAGDETLLEVLDRLLNTGVVLCGEVNISVADVELICLRLHVALTSAETAREAGWHGPERSARRGGSPLLAFGNNA